MTGGSQPRASPQCHALFILVSYDRSETPANGAVVRRGLGPSGHFAVPTIDTHAPSTIPAHVEKSKGQAVDKVTVCIVIRGKRVRCAKHPGLAQGGTKTCQAIRSD